jgi:hypothetical protein
MSPSRSKAHEAASGPTWRWFVRRSLEGLAPKIALSAAVLATFVTLAVASVWRAAGGARAGVEELVPMLGTGLRWSVALPIAWGALGAIELDRTSGVLALAARRGVEARSWVLGRAFGAGVLIALGVGVPMMMVSLVLAGFGGGLEGMLARASLVFPSIVVAIATGAIFGLGGVVLGALVSRGMAIGALLAASTLGLLAEPALPGLVGIAAHQLVSPLMALEDLQSAVFDSPDVGHLAMRGIAAGASVIALAALGVFAAVRSLARPVAERAAMPLPEIRS